MSELAVNSFEPETGGPDEPLDAVSLSALLASRLCHDLVNPVGALGSGLEVLEDENMDEMMKDAAIDLIKNGGQKSVALLSYGRLAYGAAGGRGAELPVEEAGDIMKTMFEFFKADLDWQLPAVHAPKEQVKAAMIMTYYAGADCIPRGGSVTVEVNDGVYRVCAEGPRSFLQDDLIAAMQGERSALTAKSAPGYIIGLLAREAGGQASVCKHEDGKIVFEASFPN